jgi:hypothetical protein
MVMAFAQDVHVVTGAIASSRLERDDCARAIRVCLFVVGRGPDTLRITPAGP